MFVDAGHRMLLSSKNVMSCAVITLCLTIYAYTAPTNYLDQPKLTAIEKTASNSQAASFTNQTSYDRQFVPESAVADFSLIKPLVVLPDAIAANALESRTLPAVPGAVFMTLMGVFCILFFRERRTLVTVFAGIFILSHFGIKSLPKLTARLIQGKHVTSLPAGEKSISFHSTESNHPAGRSDSIRFIGLLHRLATSTPEDGPRYHNHIPRRGLAAGIGQIAFALENQTVRAQAHFAPVSLLSHNIYPESLINHWIKRSKSIRVFSPAFYFCNLSRGPPGLDSIEFLL